MICTSGGHETLESRNQECFNRFCSCYVNLPCNEDDHTFFSPSTEHCKHPWAEIGNIDPWKPLAGQTDSEVDTSRKLKSTFYSVSPGLGCTCDVLRSVWSRSNLHTSRGTFFTVSPPNPSQPKLSDVHSLLQQPSSNEKQNIGHGGLVRTLEKDIAACLYLSLRKVTDFRLLANPLCQGFTTRICYQPLYVCVLLMSFCSCFFFY